MTKIILKQPLETQTSSEIMARKNQIERIELELAEWRARVSGRQKFKYGKDFRAGIEKQFYVYESEIRKLRTELLLLGGP